MSSNAAIKTELKDVNSDHPVVDRTAETLHKGIDRTAETAGVAEEKMRASVAETSEKLSETKVKIKDQSQEINQTIKEYVRQNPVACIGIAFAVGMVSSRLLR